MIDAETDAALFSALEQIGARPRPFEFYTARELWTDEHTSARMLAYHLDGSNDLSSRRLAFIDQSVDWLARRLGIADGVSVIDFGCGPGLYTTRLAQRGAQVTGVDFSARSIQYARRQAVDLGLDIQYLCQDYLDFSTDQRFDLALMIYCDFCALSPAQRGRLLAKFRSILKPGGRIVLDVHSRSDFDQRLEGARYEPNLLGGFWSPEPYHGFLHAFKYEAEQVTLDKHTIVARSGRKTIYNWLQYFSTESLGREFHAAGLEIFEFYSDVAGAPFDASAPVFAVVAGLAP